jgi:hypothetical protein
MKKMNVLVFPCGSENAGEIAQSLRYSLHINRLIGASSCDDHGRFHFADYIGDVPFISAPEFDSYFREMLVTHKIDVIFATHDTVCEKLAEMDDLAGCYLVNGDRETTRIARRKVSHISALRAQAGSRMFTLWKRQKAGRSLSNLTVARGQWHRTRGE